MRLSISLSVVLLAGCGAGASTQLQAQTAPLSAPVAVVSSTSATTVSAGPAAAPRPGAYSRADLDALEHQQSWTELVEHLQDVPPTQRDDHWRMLATEAVVARLKALRGGPDKVDLAHKAESIVQRYSSVSSSPAVIDARGDIYVDAVDACASNGYWYEGCDWLAHLFEGDPKHAVAAGHVAGFGNHPFAMKLYGLALASDPKMVCADDGANKLMLQGLAAQAGTDFNESSKSMRDRCRALKK